MRFDNEGREINDPTPHATAVGFQAPLTLAEQVRRMVRTQLHQAAGPEFETFEEADDFECENEVERFDPKSRYEVELDGDLDGALGPEKQPTPGPAPAPEKPDSAPVKEEKTADTPAKQ